MTTSQQTQATLYDISDLLMKVKDIPATHVIIKQLLKEVWFHTRTRSMKGGYINVTIAAHSLGQKELL